MEIAEFGHEKDKQSKPVFNYSIGYDRSNRIPLFYEVYPGSINDMFQLQCMLNKAKSFGYKNAGFILDRGYFSEPNIRFMDRNGYSYIIMVKGCKELVSQATVENRGTFEDEWEKAIPYHDVSGTTVKRPIFKKDVEERCFHLYYADVPDLAIRGFHAYQLGLLDLSVCPFAYCAERLPLAVHLELI